MVRLSVCLAIACVAWSPVPTAHASYFNFNSLIGVITTSGSPSGALTTVGSNSDHIGTPSTPQEILLFSFGQTSTVSAPATENFSYTLLNVLSIFDLIKGFSGQSMVGLNIGLNYTNVNTAMQTDTITINGVAGGVGLFVPVYPQSSVGVQNYYLSNFRFVPSKSVTGVSGALYATVNIGLVPEPGSLSLLGVAAMLGVIGSSIRHRRAA